MDERTSVPLAGEPPGGPFMTARVYIAASAALAVACGGPPCDVVDGVDRDACAALRELVLPESLPRARGNSHGDDERAALLGFHIFFDARFSSSNHLRCATCHAPESYFHDAVPIPKPPAQVSRNSPTILNAAWHRWQFWDGRADSLWSQPLFAFESPVEMGFTRLELAHRIGQSYADAYVGLFGPLPELGDGARFPARGAPGMAPFDAMNEEDKHAINQVAANVGKALEAYMRKLAAGRSPFDQFLLGDKAALSPEAKRGLRVFANEGCLDCHRGPLLSDEGFYNLGLTTDDPGRAAAAETLRTSVFAEGGPFFEGGGTRPEVPLEGAAGAFRTPSLRNVALTAPYGHDGRFGSLEEAIGFHPVAISAADRAALVTFLRTLNGAYPKLPWNNWPEK